MPKHYLPSLVGQSSHGSEHRASMIRNSNEYQQLTAEEKRAVDACPLYERAPYIMQLLEERTAK